MVAAVRPPLSSNTTAVGTSWVRWGTLCCIIALQSNHQSPKRRKRLHVKKKFSGVLLLEFTSSCFLLGLLLCRGRERSKLRVHATRARLGVCLKMLREKRRVCCVFPVNGSAFVTSAGYFTEWRQCVTVTKLVGQPPVYPVCVSCTC